MPNVTVHGLAPASYVRTVLIALAEKGVGYSLAPVELGSDAHRKLHPFGKMPVLEHDGFMVTETMAILNYVDTVFDGPALQPEDPKARARSDEWSSYHEDYFYPAMIREFFGQRVFAPMRGGKADEAIVTAALQKIDSQLGMIDARLADNAYLAGASFSPADMMVAPVLVSLLSQPESAALLGKRQALGAWLARLHERPSFQAVDPRKTAA
jgi:glutathione S-transferase